MFFSICSAENITKTSIVSSFRIKLKTSLGVKNLDCIGKSSELSINVTN